MELDAAGVNDQLRYVALLVPPSLRAEMTVPTKGGCLPARPTPCVLSRRSSPSRSARTGWRRSCRGGWVATAVHGRILLPADVRRARAAQRRGGACPGSAVPALCKCRAWCISIGIDEEWSWHRAPQTGVNPSFESCRNQHEVMKIQETDE